MFSKNSFFKYNFPPILWSIFILIISSIPSDKIPTIQILGYDKVIHIIMFFVLGFLIYRAIYFGKSRIYGGNKIALITILIVCFYGAFDELYQGLIPGRTTDFFDFIADLIGGFLSVIYTRIHLFIKEHKI